MHLWRSVRAVIRRSCTRRLVAVRSRASLALISRMRSQRTVSWWLGPVTWALMNAFSLSSHCFSNEYVSLSASACACLSLCLSELLLGYSTVCCLICAFLFVVRYTLTVMNSLHLHSLCFFIILFRMFLLCRVLLWCTYMNTDSLTLLQSHGCRCTVYHSLHSSAELLKDRRALSMEDPDF